MLCKVRFGSFGSGSGEASGVQVGLKAHAGTSGDGFSG